jgi:hypothetical protein
LTVSSPEDHASAAIAWVESEDRAHRSRGSNTHSVCRRVFRQPPRPTGQGARHGRAGSGEPESG